MKCTPWMCKMSFRLLTVSTRASTFGNLSSSSMAYYERDLPAWLV